MSDPLPLRHFVWTTVFERTARGLLAEDEILALEETLPRNPLSGATEDHAGGARKVRVALVGGGKSGGARVLYFYASHRDTIYLLLAFGKAVQASLTASQRKLLQRMVRRLESP